MRRNMPTRTRNQVKVDADGNQPSQKRKKMEAVEGKYLLCYDVVIFVVLY